MKKEGIDLSQIRDIDATDKRRYKKAVKVIQISLLFLVFVFSIASIREIEVIRQKNNQSATTNEQESAGKREQQSSNFSEVGTSSNAPQNVPDENDWKLLLVNSSNPLPEDYNVTTQKINSSQEVDSRVYPHLVQMLDDMKKNGLKPLVCSSFRSHQKQVKLYNNKIEKYISDGNSADEAAQQAALWVAPPGTSEHEAGLAVDIVDESFQMLDEAQLDTQTTKWLHENCSKYGFVVRYPDGKSEITKVNFEPWHYRYVGLENAKKITENGLCLEEFVNEY